MRTWRFGLKVKKKLSAAEIDRKVKDVAKVIEIKSEQLVRKRIRLSGGQQQASGVSQGHRFGTEDSVSR